MSDVGEPKLIELIYIKLAIKSIIDNQGRFTAIVARAAIVSDLCFDTSHFSQSCNPARTALLPLIKQIIM